MMLKPKAVMTGTLQQIMASAECHFWPWGANSPHCFAGPIKQSLLGTSHLNIHSLWARS